VKQMQMFTEKYKQRLDCH